MRASFGSKLGSLAVVAGSAIGLGNIWRFPYLVGENGGAAFILLFIFFSLAIAMPIMLTEFAIGRSTKSNAIGAFAKLSPKSIAWRTPSYFGTLTSFLILSFYCVIAGWVVNFLVMAFQNGFAGKSAEVLSTSFDSFVASGVQPIIYMVLFVIMTGIVVYFGVEKGIERYSKVMMPIMVVALIALFVYSTTMSGFDEAIAFLLKPDFSKITPKVALEAMGQSFFSLSLGMSAIATYGSYLRKEDNMLTVATSVIGADLFVALFSGLIIFPAVFTFGIEITSGPDLIFKVLPNIFAMMGSIGYPLSVIFFILIFVAAITSSISLYEVMVAYISEEFKISRKVACIIMFFGVSIFGSLCAISQMPGSSLALLGMSLFDLFDAVTANVLMPIGSLLAVMFVAWKLGKRWFLDEISSQGVFKSKFYNFFFFSIKYVAPIIISLLLLSFWGVI